MPPDRENNDSVRDERGEEDGCGDDDDTTGDDNDNSRGVVLNALRLLQTLELVSICRRSADA